jgi:peptidoglycan/LPS O-acetylase OafA/YrhL
MEHRQPQRHDTILSLTGIRGAAAMLVLAHHLPIAQSFGIKGTMPVITNGNYGVELFFLLSGF